MAKTQTDQIRRWVSGISVHAPDGMGSWQCAPDFSCCYPDLLQPPKVRQAFAKARGEARTRFLVEFLTRFADSVTAGSPSENRVLIIGGGKR